MPPIRFRVKTIIIVIAALAVVMGLLRFRRERGSTSTTS